MQPKLTLPPLKLMPALMLTILSLWACAGRNRRPAEVQAAFYYWQTTLALSNAETNYLDSLHCRKLYIKILDIGTDEASGEAVPLARLVIRDTAGLGSRHIVPCIFIANRVFQTTAPARIERLAQNTAALCRSVVAEIPAGNTPAIWQFDCDWTPGTRAAYFDFLKKIRARLPEGSRLSATIRLHQYKFPGRTGVPPVDRGMLMLYNTGDIEDWQTPNSIFQPADARKYLVGAPRRYPLPLDLALPVFSWSLVYRNGALWKIIPALGDRQLADTAFFTPQNGNAWLVKRETLREGHYLRAGDWIRREGITPELLKEAARLGRQVDLDSHPDLVFFHLDTAALRRYPVPLLDSVCRILM